MVQFFSLVERPGDSESATAYAEAKVEHVKMGIALPLVRGKTAAEAIVVWPAEQHKSCHDAVMQGVMNLRV